MKVKELGIKREKGFLYFIKGGNVVRCAMSRAGRTTSKPKQEVVAETDMERKKGFLYFLDSDGDIACKEMARGRKKK